MKFEVNEGSSGVYTGTLVDENGDPVAASALESAKLTLIDRATGSVINSRDGQNVLNANGVTFGDDGSVAWAFTAADMPIVTAAKQFETHVAVFDCRWASGAKRLIHDVEIRVRNIAGITA